MKKITFLAIVLIVCANCFAQYNTYAIRYNTDGTKDTFLVKFFTDSVFNKNFVYVQRTKEYYDQFYMPDYPNAFEKYFEGADNIWRNVLLPDSDISGTTGINTTTQTALNSKADLNAPNFSGILSANNILATGGIVSTGQTGIGYFTGAGGTVTQNGNKGNAVTLNKICGQITTTNSALAAGAEVAFTLNNSTIAATDVVYACISSGGTIGSYLICVSSVSDGACTITLSNVSTGSLSQALVINFTVIKATTN